MHLMMMMMMVASSKHCIPCAATKFPCTEQSCSLLTLQSSVPTTAEDLCTVVRRKPSAICSHREAQTCKEVFLRPCAVVETWFTSVSFNFSYQDRSLSTDILANESVCTENDIRKRLV